MADETKIDALRGRNAGISDEILRCAQGKRFQLPANQARPSSSAECGPNESTTGRLSLYHGALTRDRISVAILSCNTRNSNNVYP